MDYSEGGGQGTASCRSLTGLLQSPYFLCSYVHLLVNFRAHSSVAKEYLAARERIACGDKDTIIVNFSDASLLLFSARTLK